MRLDAIGECFPRENGLVLMQREAACSYMQVDALSAKKIQALE